MPNAISETGRHRQCLIIASTHFDYAVGGKRVLNEMKENTEPVRRLITQAANEPFVITAFSAAGDTHGRCPP